MGLCTADFDFTCAKAVKAPDAGAGAGKAKVCRRLSDFAFASEKL